MTFDADSSLVVNGFDIRTLSDDELYDRLTTAGATVGPVVESTRKTYQRKLAVLMGGSVPNYSFTEEPFEDVKDDDVSPSQAYCDFLASGLDKNARRRQRQREVRADDLNYDDDDEVVAEPPLSSSYASFSSRSFDPPLSPTAHNLSSRSTSALVEEQDETDAGVAADGNSGLFFKVIFVIFVAVIVYFIFLSRKEQDAFKSLEELAQSASDAIDRSHAKTK